MPATISTSGNVARINLAGEFYFSSQAELKQIFEKALSASAQAIQIDMQKTIFIDSSIIRFFLKLNDNARKNNKTLTIINCNERIYQIFTIGGFDQIFIFNKILYNRPLMGGWLMCKGCAFDVRERLLRA